MSSDRWNKIKNHQARLAVLGVLCFLFVATVLVAPNAKAEDTKTCILLVDFGNGQVKWTDVPVHDGMNGFDVFLNATNTMGLSETHSATPPFGHTVQRIQNSSMQYNFANPAASGGLWRLWLWNSTENNWTWSYTLLDGINAMSTPAIALKYHTDPAPGPSLSLNNMDAWPAKTTATTSSSNESNATNESTNNPTNNSIPGYSPANVATNASNFDYVVNDRNVTFQASSSNQSSVSNYTWSFGDGSTAQGKSVNHSYPTEGNFTVTMTSVNKTGDEKNVSQIVRLGLDTPSPKAPTQVKSQVFPIWAWGVLALVLITAAEVTFLYRKKRKGNK